MQKLFQILKKYYFIIFVLLFSGQGQLLAQIQKDNSDSSKIELLFSKKMRGVETDEGDYLILQGDVHLKQNEMHMWCDTAKRFPDKRIIAYGNVEMLQNDSIRVFSDSVFYDGNTQKSRLNGDVVLQDSSMTMFTEELFYDLNSKIANYPNGALIISDSSQLVSKSGYYDANTRIAYFSDSVRMTNPNYKLTADSLAFDTENEVTLFKGPTFIYNEEDLVYCEGGFFDNEKNYAQLTGKPYYLQRNQDGYKKAYGDTILYDGEIDKYFLIGNAVFEDGDKEVRADTIVRDGETNNFFFKGNPKFRNLDSTQSQTIDSKYSFYDSKNEKVTFREDVKVVDKNQIMIADSLDYYQISKTGIAKGRVVWEDLSAKVRILCGEAIYDDSNGSFLAKKNPIMVSKMDNDSLWLRADTLRAISDNLQKDKKTFYAYNNVKIYKTDIQGLCDSLTYNQNDSTFQFFNKPVLWMDSVQFTADTIKAHMSDGKMKSALLTINSMIISTNEQKYFNQIKGRNMIADFIENKINTLEVQSNGKAVYYVTDNQNRYMGVNDVNCSDMNMYFNNNEINRIKFTGEPQAVLYPMLMTDHIKLRLKEFIWLEDKRPKSKFEITKNNDWSYRLKEVSSNNTNFILSPDSIHLTPDSLENPFDSITNSNIIENKSSKIGKEEKKEIPETPTLPSKKSKLDRKKDD